MFLRYKFHYCQKTILPIYKILFVVIYHVILPGFIMHIFWFYSTKHLPFVYNLLRQPVFLIRNLSNSVGDAIEEAHNK